MTGTIDTPLREALQLIRDENWTPPWQGYSIQGWCVEDALQQVTRGLANGVATWKLAYAMLSDAAGGDVLEWERQPGRKQREVEVLFEGVLDGT